MKIRAVCLLVIISSLFFMMGRTTAQNRPTIDQRTLEHLSTAMRGEAFAYAKYMLYAQHARKSGHLELARLFEETAKDENLRHFTQEAELAGVVRSDAENLKDAIQNETANVDSMYRNFLAEASFVGDNEAVDCFHDAIRDEVTHRDAFKTALDKLASETKGKK